MLELMAKGDDDAAESVISYSMEPLPGQPTLDWLRGDTTSFHWPKQQQLSPITFNVAVISYL